MLGRAGVEVGHAEIAANIIVLVIERNCLYRGHCSTGPVMKYVRLATG